MSRFRLRLKNVHLFPPNPHYLIFLCDCFYVATRHLNISCDYQYGCMICSPCIWLTWFPLLSAQYLYMQSKKEITRWCCFTHNLIAFCPLFRRNIKTNRRVCCKRIMHVYWNLNALKTFRRSFTLNIHVLVLSCIVNMDLSS